MCSDKSIDATHTKYNLTTQFEYASYYNGNSVTLKYCFPEENKLTKLTKKQKIFSHFNRV